MPSNRSCATIDAVDEFQIYLWRADDIRDKITIRLELKPGREAEWPEVREKMAKALADAHEGLRFNLELMPAGSLPRFELKAKRLVDARPTAQYAIARRGMAETQTSLVAAAAALSAAGRLHRTPPPSGSKHPRYRLSGGHSA